MTRENKDLVLSLTKDDFDWKYSRGSGPGGQHKNVRDSRVVVTHEPSGARGESQDERSQLQNRRTALVRLTETPQFKSWLAAKTRGLKTPKELEAEVEESVNNPANIKLEVREGKGWKEVSPDELT